MIQPVFPEQALRELGRTGGGPDTLALLVRDQHTRRLLLLRAVLDAVEAADERICPSAVRARVREDWALLEEADETKARGDVADEEAHGVRVPPHGTSGAGQRGMPYGAAGGPPAAPGPALPHVPRTTGTRGRHSPARALLLYPLVGPWARSCLRALGAGAGALPGAGASPAPVSGAGPGPVAGPVSGPAEEHRRRTLARDLAHFSVLAAVAAARADAVFSVRLTARAGVLVLPSLGALRTAGLGDVPVDAVFADHRLTLRQPGAADVVVRWEQSGTEGAGSTGAWSEAAAWSPAHALPGLLPGSAHVPLDDLDPYRTVNHGRPHQQGLSGPAALDGAERRRWLRSWSGTAELLGLGGEQRVGEAVALLRCLVPLAAPVDYGTGGAGTGNCSGTRREAFGAVLSSTPPAAATFAATLVHELQHAKLAALSDMVVLHHANSEERYFAPWRPDPRPYDGLLQGVYSHVALADFFQRCALAAAHPAHRASAWGRHARYREQLKVALPVVAASDDLTPSGRLLVGQLSEAYERMAENPPPGGARRHAQAYVDAAQARFRDNALRPKA
ncbi:aKG-HExxH-type peptide beta-hydroxylase [Streptomyces avermitilis]|uniref:aKG-HExxH-type peptide beta-hydroxylase n=1 Tax=Streptomyces avermitilis TaxID=33903 RepID=UPI00367892D9